jgi:membrane protein
VPCVARSLPKMPPSLLRHFRPGTLPLRAAALTYYTFLGLVPLAALSLAVLELLHLEGLSQHVRRFFLTELGLVQEASRQIGSLLGRADARLLGSLSGILFLGSAFALVHNVEAALNEIFQVRQPRPLGARLLSYLGFFTLGPVCLGLSLILTGLWQGSPLGQLPVLGLTLAVGPFCLALLALFLLYRFGPHARTTSFAAAVGAAVAGPSWEIAKQLYAGIAVHAYHRNALLYGPLAAIPVLLLWIQVSWLIVLGGARLAASLQGIRPA